MKRLNFILGVAFSAAILFSGCASKHKPGTFITNNKVEANVANIHVDRDSTQLGFIKIGDVVRMNYKLALGTAAQTTLDKGFKYYSFVGPKPFLEMIEIHNVANAQAAYDMCDSGDERFHMGLSLRNTFKNFATKCDSLVIAWQGHTMLGLQVLHRAINFDIVMSNEKISNNSLDAKEVLSSELLADIEPQMYKATE